MLRTFDECPLVVCRENFQASEERGNCMIMELGLIELEPEIEGGNKVKMHGYL